jgi:hypothetical protein
LSDMDPEWLAKREALLAKFERIRLK